MALRLITPFSILQSPHSIARISCVQAYQLQQTLKRRLSITDATRPDFIRDLQSAKRTASKPGGWHPTLIHSSGEVKWTVIRLQPDGGEVPNHLHSKSWDYFIPLEGHAIIETETKDGEKVDFEMSPGSFLAIGPEDAHRVRNLSKEKEFVFLIAQAPRGEYDFVAK